MEMPIPEFLEWQKIAVKVAKDIEREVKKHE